MARLVVAYSGRPSAESAFPLLAGHVGAEIVGLTLDLGQGEDLTGVRESALRAGAVRAHVMDAREELIRTVVLPCLQAGAFEVRWPMAAELSRLVVARHLAGVGAMEDADAIAHGSGSVAGQRVFELAAAGRPAMRVVPFGEVLPDVPGPGSATGCLWGRPVGPGEAFRLTCDPEDCPAEPARIDVAFERGVPLAINDVEMTLVEIVESLDTLAGAHGVGRSGERASSGPCEAPAAAVLREAYTELRRLTLSSAAVATEEIGRKTVALVQTGDWFTAARTPLDDFLALATPLMSGIVRLHLLRGTCTVLDGHSGVTAPAGQSPH